MPNPRASLLATHPACPAGSTNLLAHPGAVITLRALVATPRERERIYGHGVKAVDATGAGDCFDGAFLAEYVRHGDAFAAARFANVAAALSTLGYGAVTPLPRRADVDAVMAARTR